MERAGPGKSTRNERRKLMASLLNTLAGAAVTVGVLAPIAGMLYGVTVPAMSAVGLVVALAVWLVAGLILHVIARVVLGRIEE